MTANSSSGGGETSKVGPKTRQSSAASHQTPSTNNKRGAANASKKASSSQKTLKSTTLSTGGVKNSLCITRLQHERDQWPKDHPFGFTAKPYKESPTSFANIMIWECLIPGRPNGLWHGGFYRLILTFPTNYPLNPPVARFVPSIVHPNVYPSGTVCLSILQDKWKPNITIKQILLGIQDLLDYPNLLSPAQSEAFALLTKNPEKYAALTKEYAKQNSQPFLKPHLPLHNQLDKSGSQQQTMEV